MTLESFSEQLEHPADVLAATDRTRLVDVLRSTVPGSGVKVTINEENLLVVGALVRLGYVETGGWAETGISFTITETGRRLLATTEML